MGKGKGVSKRDNEPVARLDGSKESAWKDWGCVRRDGSNDSGRLGGGIGIMGDGP